MKVQAMKLISNCYPLLSFEQGGVLSGSLLTDEH